MTVVSPFLQLVQNRAHLYNVLLLKVILFNHWLSGLLQQAHSLPGLTACPVGSVLRAGLALMEVPVWLVLRVPRLVWAGMLGCARALGLDPKQPGAWEQLGLSAATWMDLLLSCLHSLMLAALLLLLPTCRLLWRAHRCSLGRLPSKVGGRVQARLLRAGLGAGHEQGWARGLAVGQCSPVSSWWPPAHPLRPSRFCWRTRWYWGYWP